MIFGFLRPQLSSAYCSSGGCSSSSSFNISWHGQVAGRQSVTQSVTHFFFGLVSNSALTLLSDLSHTHADRTQEDLWHERTKYCSTESENSSERAPLHMLCIVAVLQLWYMLCYVGKGASINDVDSFLRLFGSFLIDSFITRLYSSLSI